MRLRFPLAACLLLVARSALAQDLEPPRLVERPPAELPDVPAPVEIELEITVLPSGAVKDVRVVDGRGGPLEEAVVRAASRFVFSPAKKDGVPAAARIRHRFRVESRPAPAPAPSPPSAAPPVTPPPTSPSPSYGAEARVEAPAREATRRTLTGPELAKVPGTRGDALRPVELLPGVARAPFGNGLPLVRGSYAHESQVFFEGMPVPLLYHFGGLTSFVSSGIVDRVDLYPGNFSARYGRKLGGVIEVTARAPRADGVHGVADVNLVDASVLGETKLGDGAAVLAAGRRSVVDAIFAHVVPEDAFEVAAAPVYWDYQAIAALRLSDSHRLRVLGYGSSDTLALVFAKPADADPALRGAFDLETAFHRAQVGLKSRLSERVEQSVDLAVGSARYDVALGAVTRQRIRETSLTARAEWRVRVSPSLRLMAGIDHTTGVFHGYYEGPPLTTREGTDVPSSTQAKILLPAEATFHSPAAYLEAQWRPAPRLLIVPGLRADAYGQIERGTLDPRVSLQLAVTSTTKLKAGLGSFSQPPEPWEPDRATGNPALRPSSAVHTSLGVEQRLGDSAQIGLEGWAKWLRDLVIESPGGRAPYYTNDGRGRAAGLELFARVQAARVFGVLSYTLSRSERGEPLADYTLFDKDQTHILAAAAGADLGRGWHVGATFRFVSGNPLTPVTGSVYDARVDLYRPVFGPRNSERAPAFHRLDLRVEKRWTFRTWRLATTLDVQNVYNATPSEGFTYNYDYTKRAPTPGLPIFPSLGLRGEL